ncbi:hypothetical protein BHE74_00039663 [Ensete ventricosum]|nr:hypothetical protein BHE74_00039663 [Ensete ventricosum]
MCVSSSTSIGKRLGSVPQLGLLGSAFRVSPSQSLPRDLARRPRRDGGVRCDLSNNQVIVMIEMTLRAHYEEREREREVSSPSSCLDPSSSYGNDDAKKKRIQICNPHRGPPGQHCAVLAGCKQLLLLHASSSLPETYFCLKACTDSNGHP